MIIVGASSLLVLVLALGLLGLQVWLFGRFLSTSCFGNSSPCSKARTLERRCAKAKSSPGAGADLPWYQRPMWRGVFIASFGLRLLWRSTSALNGHLSVNIITAITSSTDPQVVLEALRANRHRWSFNRTMFALGLVQKLLTPLLGIAFVLLFTSIAGRAVCRSGRPLVEG